jgi:hypothetical protein
VTETDDQMAAEQRRAAAVSSIAAVAGRHVDDLAELPAEDLPAPLRRLGAPPEWRLANLAGSPVQPARVAVYGQQPDGSWDGCETIRAFGFTGALPADVVRDNAACTLRDLNAENITAGALAAPPAPAATAVRSSGYFIIAGRGVWAQFSTYLANPTPAARGLLIEHSLVIDSGCRARLDDDIINLSNSIHHAFLAAIKHTSGFVGVLEENQAMTRAQQDSFPNPGFRHFRYDATGLRGKRMRLMDDLPTSDSGRPQEALIGLTDVICLDDTPSVLHNLRVHPVGQPDTEALVAFDQLALYDDQ